MREADFTTVTEVTGYKVTREQIERMYTRYRFASEFCEGKEVLEVARGSGQGLGHLAKKAKKVIGGDIDKNNLRFAREYYKDKENIELKILDAHKLPFDNNSFDLVILYEAIYYLANPEQFVKEAKRVLRKGGNLLICTANKDWSGFNPSPYSHKYFSAHELFGLLKQNNFGDIVLYGDCPVIAKTFKNRIISLIKRKGVALKIIPKTMEGN